MRFADRAWWFTPSAMAEARPKGSIVTFKRRLENCPDLSGRFRSRSIAKDCRVNAKERGAFLKRMADDGAAQTP
jgi:hypothetical protein